MNYYTAYYTDVGIKKHINEDSLLIKKASTTKGNIYMAIVCDGMGGLASGEVASASVIETFSNWFDSDLEKYLKNKVFDIAMLEKPIDRLLKEKNQRILEYGKSKNINLGTTVSGIIIFQNKYIIFHVGDTRIYCLKNRLIQLTEDQTWVNNEIKNGRITKEEAHDDPRKNVLLQCIGASKKILPEFYYGDVRDDDIFIICSDGFRHMISEEEIYSKLKLSEFTSKVNVEQNLYELVEINKVRNEIDNITALIFRCSEEECSWQ